MIYPQLPEDILIYLFTFLGFSEKMRLDSAMTNHSFREQWNEFLKKRIFNRISDLKLWRREEITMNVKKILYLSSWPKRNAPENQMLAYYFNSEFNLWNLTADTVLTNEDSRGTSMKALFELSTGHIVAFHENGIIERWDVNKNRLCKAPKFSNSTKALPILLKNDLIAYRDKRDWIRIINPLKWTCENTCYDPQQTEIAMFAMMKNTESGVSSFIIFWSGYEIRRWHYENDGTESNLIFKLPSPSRYVYVSSSITYVTFKDCKPLHESHRIVTMNSNTVIEVWDLETNLVELTISLSNAYFRSIYALRDERLMVRIPNESEKSPDIFQVWNLKGKESPQEPNLVLKPDKNVVCYDVMKSEENETLVTVDSDGSMYFWNLDTGASDVFERPRQVPYKIPSRDPTIRCFSEGKIAINTSSALEIWKPVK